jgi:methyl-accepting chemotaxis protein
MTIRLKLIAGFVLMLAFLMINSVLLISLSNDSSNSYAQIDETSKQLQNKVLPLIAVTQELRVNVIQVQQWLTDISATRGLDGLNDGFDEAEAQAQAFQANLSKALELTKSLDKPELTSALTEMGNAFSPYFEIGKKMAAAYVADGPAGGNKMMGNFDAVAAKIQDSVADVTQKVTGFVAATNADNGKILADSQAKNTSSKNMAFIPIMISIVVGIAAIVGVLGICRNVTQMTDTMKELTEGNLDVEVPGKGRSDELGDMADSVEFFKQSAKDARNLTEERALADAKSAEELRNALMTMADDLDERVSGSMQEINSVLDGLEQMSAQMSSAADQTSAQSQAVSAATEETSVNMDAVSSSGSQLTASINEIAQQVSQSSQIAQGAVTEAQQTTDVIAGLADEVGRIENVVKLITDIAEQTNMLALNATIEAARAGDAGKGFAVVASEVKNLAQQTAKATDEISLQIGKIQDQTTGAVGAIDGIAKTISNLNDYSSSVAAAVEEQSAATGEIAHNVSEAARGTEEISGNITGVAKAAGETGQLAHDVSNAANQVKEASQSLRTRVQEFLDDVRDGSSGAIRY